MWEPISVAYLCGINKKILRRSFNLEIMSCGFQKEKNIYGNCFLKNSLVNSGYNIAYPII
jgi:hypothetical protein